MSKGTRADLVLGSSNAIGWDIEGTRCEDGSAAALVSTGEPRIFGPIIWPALHVMAENYPESPAPRHHLACTQFLEGLPYLLPCGYCGSRLLREEAQTKLPAGKGEAMEACLRRHDIREACSSRDAFRAFLVEAHNNVNRHNDKPTWTPAQAEHHYATVPACLTDGKAGWFSGVKPL